MTTEQKGEFLTDAVRALVLAGGRKRWRSVVAAALRRQGWISAEELADVLNYAEELGFFVRLGEDLVLAAVGRRAAGTSMELR